MNKSRNESKPHSAADEVIADLNKDRSNSMSSDTSGCSLNFADILDANYFLTSLSSKASHWSYTSHLMTMTFSLTKVSKLQRAYNQMVVGWQFGTALYSNVQHTRKQISRNNAKIYERFLPHTWSVPRVFVNISVLEKCIHNAKLIAGAKL